MTILKQRNSGWLMKKVEKELEKTADEASAMLEAWKNGITELQFRIDSGEELPRHGERPILPNHCKKHDLWKRTIIPYEQQFQNLDDNGMPAISMIGANGPLEWTVFYLHHKPSKCHYHRNLILYSNGMMSTGYEEWHRTGGGCGGSWIPGYLPNSEVKWVSDYEEHIEKIHQDGLDWIERNFKDKPRVRQRMLDSLDEQMNHDRFRGLHWRN
tara:strand:+ start:7089 stop:7727 length:639 start_codon:yes stop_codon:yes gene_type:complete